MNRANSLCMALQALVMITGAIVLILATRQGVSLGADSFGYVTAARNILAGQGYVRESSTTGESTRTTQWPPFFPIVLAALATSGVDVLDAVRWLNVFLFPGNILLVGLLIRRYTGELNGSVVLGSALYLTSEMLRLHTVPMSDALFLFLAFLGILFLDIYIERGKRLVLIVSATCIGFCFFTRYSGAAFVATGIGGVLLFARKDWPGRIKDSIFFALLGCAPVGLWTLRNIIHGSSSSSREFLIHPISIYHLKPGLDTVLGWAVPEGIQNLGSMKDPLMISLIALVVLWVVLIRHNRASEGQGSGALQRISRVPALLGGLAVTYVAFLITSISFFDAMTRFTSRHLAPVFTCLLILVFCLVHTMVRSASHPMPLRVASSLLAFALLGWFGFGAVSQVISYYRGGIGYARDIWRKSQVLQRVKAVPLGIKAHTNSHAPMRIYDRERKSFRLPLKYYPQTGLPNQDLAAELQVIRMDLEECEGVIVWFNRRRYEYLPTEAELIKSLDLVVLDQQSDGTIYGAQECDIMGTQ